MVAVHGVNQFEKESAQPFEIDLNLYVDLTAAGKSDDLNDTVNYGEVSVIVSNLVQSEQHELLERVAQRICEELLQINRVEKVDVTLRKLRPPIPVDVATAAVSITRP